jgi:hypothetical protein
MFLVQWTPVTMACYVLRMEKEKKACRYGGVTGNILNM